MTAFYYSVPDDLIFRARTVPEKVRLKDLFGATLALAIFLEPTQVPADFARFLSAHGLQGNVEGEEMVLSRR